MVENNVILIGRLVADAEVRNISGENRVANFTVAVNRPRRKDAEGEADFIDIEAWNATADFVCKYFSKGSKIGIRGRIHTSMYEDKDGKRRKQTNILAEEVCFVESKTTKSDGDASPKPETKKTDVDVSADDDDLPF